jgi:hypothetical protein
LTGNVSATATFVKEQRVSAKPLSIDFGGVGKNISSPPKTISIENKGTYGLIIGSIELTGTNAPEFQVGNDCLSTLLKNETCSITVTAVAVDLGKLKAEVRINSNDPAHPILTAQIKGKAKPGKISVNRTSIDFGAAKVFETVASVVKVKNMGPSDLTIQSTEVTGTNHADFGIGSLPCPVLHERDECEISVVFSPGSKGARTGRLDIISDDLKRQLVSVGLKGKGK